MLILKKQFFLVFLLFSLLGIGQTSAVYTSEFKTYQDALNLFHNKQYKAAQALFDEARSSSKDAVLSSDCSYYIAFCAVRLNQSNADILVTEFVENYPTNNKRNRAFLDVADYYFLNAKYAYARKWYQKADVFDMPSKAMERYNFNYGYSLYATKDEIQATKYLNRVVDSKTYGSQAKYYLGYMAYQGNDYDTANMYFDQVNGSESYKAKLSYYQADLNFKLGNFEKAMVLAKAQLPKARGQETSELNKIIGECYFNLEQYNEAIPYLKAYKGKSGKWNNTDHYQLGYAHYKQADYERAIAQFNRIIDGNNTVAQNAYYHLGESYINLEKKQEALNAFKTASEMDYDPKIQEDAWLNYAKLSYQIGNPYQSVPQVLTTYLEAYPNTKDKATIESLLIDSYISSKNYEEALELLKGKSSSEHKLAYQKVAFLRGITFYNSNKFNEASLMFQRSLKVSKDPIYAAKATFWEAETNYNLTNYNAALSGFEKFAALDEAANLPEYTNLDYNLAYTYFKRQDYNNASVYFKAFIEHTDRATPRKADAYLRLADGYFVLSEYQKAITAYNKAIESRNIETDYPTFQKAMAYGYMGDNTTKIEALKRFIDVYPNSGLRDDALYALGNAFVDSEATDRALETYKRLVDQYPESAFMSKAILRQGLVYYNANNKTPALTKFKHVAQEYPGTAEAVEAVALARLIYIDLGQVDQYATWAKTLDYVEVSDKELDNTMYLAAEQSYLANQSDKATRQFNTYLNRFPNGIHALKAHFYLAQLYDNKGLSENALPHYIYVAQASKSEYTEQAMVKLCTLYLKNSDWIQAIPALIDLEANADYPQNILYAQSNLMNAYDQTKDSTMARRYAMQLLEREDLNDDVKQDAQLIIARNAFVTGDKATAKAIYAAIERTAIGAIMAEALYYRAYFENEDLAYEASNSTVQRLVKDYSSNKYYSAKSLIIMAKNFYALDDAFQATYILESVSSNFSEFDDVVQLAMSELKIIKSQEAKTNSSIEINDN